MMDIFLLRVKLGRVAEIVISCPTAHISLRSTVAPCGRWVGLGDDLDLTIGFYHPALPLDRPRTRTTLPLPPDLIF